MSTVEKIEEKTIFISTDGTVHESMDAACNHQEKTDFLDWMESTLRETRYFRDSPRAFAIEILKHFKVQPKEPS